MKYVGPRPCSSSRLESSVTMPVMDSICGRPNRSGSWNTAEAQMNDCNVPVSAQWRRWPASMRHGGDRASCIPWSCPRVPHKHGDEICESSLRPSAATAIVGTASLAYAASITGDIESLNRMRARSAWINGPTFVARRPPSAPLQSGGEGDGGLFDARVGARLGARRLDRPGEAVANNADSAGDG